MQLCLKKTSEGSCFKLSGHTLGLIHPNLSGQLGQLSNGLFDAYAWAAHGKRFDGLYLVDMTLHHQGAIAMARPLTHSSNPEVAALCKAIVSGQSAEIKQMRSIMMTGK